MIIATVLICILCTFFGIYYLTKTYKLKTPLKSDPVLLFPSYFFDEVFKEYGEKKKIEKLQNEVVSLRGYVEGEKQRRKIVRDYEKNIKVVDQTDAQIYSISRAVRELERLYLECIKCYLEIGNSGDSTEIETGVKKDHKKRRETLENKIVLCRKLIENERVSFQTDNGDTFLSFTMNRQNEFSNFLITGVMVPMLMEAIGNNISSFRGFVSLINTNPVMRVTTCGFLILLAYRFWKYFRNKYSMLTSANQVIMYNKAEELLTAFECALKDIG